MYFGFCCINFDNSFLNSNFIEVELCYKMMANCFKILSHLDKGSFPLSALCAARSLHASKLTALSAPFEHPSQGHEIQTCPHFHTTVLKNPSLATVGHWLIMPTYSQWHWFPLINVPISQSEALTSPPPKQLDNPPVKTPGGKESAQRRFEEGGLLLPIQPADTFLECTKLKVLKVWEKAELATVKEWNVKYVHYSDLFLNS